MTEQHDLPGRMRDAPVPDELAARERGWRVVSGAFAEREPDRPPRRRPVAAALAVVAAAIGVALALTPPGEAIGDWVRAVVGAPATHTPPPRPVLGPLPGHGRLLVVARTGAWIVGSDGTRRRLGAYEDATFSPRGLFVAVTRGDQLAAVDPRGGVRWSLTRTAPVTQPAWSPDGFRVAYRSGWQLRVVYGDGALDRPLARRSAPVTPAWHPAVPAHRLAWADRRGRVTLSDADSGRTVWRTRAAGRVRQLAWSPDGRRLVAVTPAGVRVLSATGRTVAVRRTPAGTQVQQVAWSAGGHRFAVLRTGSRGSEVVLAGGDGASRPATRRLIALPGRITGMLAAPGGRRLLLAAPDADQWLLVPAHGGGHTAASSPLGRQFDPGGSRRPVLPRPVDWLP